MQIQRLSPTHPRAYRELMLQAYADHPEAFTSSATERAKLPDDWWEKRLDPSPLASELVMGALQGPALIGVAGLSFDSREKARHKATLFGMYVPPAARGQGAGRALVMATLETARLRPGVGLVQLTVTEGNTAAQALYQSCGFVPFGIEPFAVAVGTGFVSKVHMWCGVAPGFTPAAR